MNLDQVAAWGFAGVFVTQICNLIITFRHHKENKEKLDVVSNDVNGKMQQLIELAKQAGIDEGILIEKNRQKQGQK